MATSLASDLAGTDAWGKQVAAGFRDRPDRKVVFTGSNNFSGSGFITNEENSVMLRSPANTTRISWFICDIDKMFDIGVEAGKPQLSDAARKTALLALDQCNGARCGSHRPT